VSYKTDTSVFLALLKTMQTLIMNSLSF